MELKLFNTMGRRMETFAPITDKKVGMYACGLTVYNFAHIGNLRSYIFEDILRKTLEYCGYQVRHVMNVTDVGHLTGDTDEGEDKMVKSSRETGRTVWEIAEFYTKAFFRDFTLLRCAMPTVVCKATDHIQDMIDLIRRIEANGFTYSAGGNLYFDIARFPDYGKLALLDQQDLRAGARVVVDQGKRNPFDFVAVVHEIEVRASGHALGFPVGPRLPRMAHRVQRNVHEVSWGAFRPSLRRDRPRARPSHQ